MVWTKLNSHFSLSDVNPNPDWASLLLFERTGWKRMTFGEFAERIGERAEPKDAREEMYVGREHLDPQCLYIRRWGKGSDVIGGELRFRQGDIIFGKRRAYQRKLAVAEFGGMCFTHAIVIEARPDNVPPDFLPFLVMSARIFNRAIVSRIQERKTRRREIFFMNAVNEVTRECAQSFLTDKNLLRVVRAYQNFEDEPGFTCVVPIEEIRAKEGNLSIPLYVGGETQAQTDAATETATSALPDAIAMWLTSAKTVRDSLQGLLSTHTD